MSLSLVGSCILIASYQIANKTGPCLTSLGGVLLQGFGVRPRQPEMYLYGPLVQRSRCQISRGVFGHTLGTQASEKRFEKLSNVVDRRVS
jgi:hypothetical protein